MNEIKIEVKSKVYRLTNLNNGNKYDRAQKSAGLGAGPEKILAYYDKLSGRIEDEDCNPKQNGLYWKTENKKDGQKLYLRKILGRIEKITEHPVISSIIVIFVLAFLWYFLGVDLSRFK